MFKALSMKPVHTHGAPQPTLGFISIDMFFHTVSTCHFKIARENGNDGQVPASFLMAYFWVQQGSLLFDRNKTDRQTNAKHALDSYLDFSI